MHQRRDEVLAEFSTCEEHFEASIRHERVSIGTSAFDDRIGGIEGHMVTMVTLLVGR